MTAPQSANPADLSLVGVARVHVSAAARTLATMASALVPAHVHPDAGPDNTIRRALRATLQAQHVLALAVYRARAAGQTWTEIGDQLTVHRQSAHRTYADGVQDRNDQVLWHWFTGTDAPDMIVENPRAEAEALDAWVATRSLPELPDGKPALDQPVSFVLHEMDLAERRDLLLAAAGAILEWETRCSADQIRALRIGYGARLVGYWQFALDEAKTSPGGDPDAVRAWLVAAERYLATARLARDPGPTVYAQHIKQLNAHAALTTPPDPAAA